MMENSNTNTAVSSPNLSDTQYFEWLKKFDLPKTTDDCITPVEIYKAVKTWACDRYGIKEEQIVRPFYPGGDYENYNYPDGCVVLDNPPFSLFSSIVDFYTDKKIPFFLFCAKASTFQVLRKHPEVCAVCIDVPCRFDNGANVPISFLTNLEKDYVAISSPSLQEAIKCANAKVATKTTRALPSYTYNNHVLTAAMLGRLSKYGVELCVRKGSCEWVKSLDSQKPFKKAIFGAGLLLSEKAAAEKAAAEKAAAEKAAAEKAAAEKAAAKTFIWGLSEREKELIRRLV